MKEMIMEENSKSNDTVTCVEENLNLGLYLYTYKECSATDNLDHKLKRSIIQDTENNIITRSLPYTTEIEDLSGEIFQNIQWSEYDILPSIEGTLVRLFYYKNDWILSTNRKIDAFTSYWSCRFSFGQLFWNHLAHIYQDHVNYLSEYFYGKLDKTCTYFFLIQSNAENRIVCISQDPKLYYIGKYVGNNYNVLCREPFDTEESIPRVSPIQYNINNSQDMIEYIMGHVLPFETQGVLLFHKQQNEQIKIFHPQYRKYWKIRNNIPNLQLRYLQLRMQSDDDINQFFILYPKFRVMADRLENTLLEISRLIYNAYINRFIRKQYVSVPRDMYHILKTAHSWHLQDRTLNKIYFHKIMSFVNEQDPKLLLNIIKNFFKKEKNNSGEYPRRFLQTVAGSTGDVENSQ